MYNNTVCEGLQITNLYDGCYSVNIEHLQCIQPN